MADYRLRRISKEYHVLSPSDPRPKIPRLLDSVFKILHTPNGPGYTVMEYTHAYDRVCGQYLQLDDAWARLTTLLATRRGEAPRAKPDAEHLLSPEDIIPTSR